MTSPSPIGTNAGAALDLDTHSSQNDAYEYQYDDNETEVGLVRSFSPLFTRGKDQILLMLRHSW